MKSSYFNIASTLLLATGMVVAVFFLEYVQLLDSVRFLGLKVSSPAVSVLQKSASESYGFVRGLFEISNLVKENEQMQAELEKKDKLEAEYAQVKIENEQLRKAAGVSEDRGIDLLPCNILGADIGGLSGGVVIGCGEVSGVKEGMAVLIDDSVFGVVALAQKSTATVRPLSLAGTTLDAITFDTVESPGVIKGSAGVGVVFELIDKSVSLSPDTLLVTGGVNERVRPGLPIGRIASRISGEKELVQRYAVKVKTNLLNYRVLFVAK
ncbi:MAG TPA: rod shape-determining protein MreC [Patescibacteria group bacterium]|nr:rod shape-determining protein MreC [Patescibacteria group bacterium]